ncbi:MAG: sigma-54 interaction domain-containing protein, partial [Blastocatellia bacterium]
IDLTLNIPFSASGLQANLCVRSDFNPDLVFLVLPATTVETAVTAVSMIKGLVPDAPITVVVETDEPNGLLELLQSGASDFVIPPLRAVDILPRVWRLLDSARPEDPLSHSLTAAVGLSQLVGEAPVFQAEVRKLPVIAKCDAAVLISGETGTGKDLCARAIHYLSPRHGKPFVPVNCGAVPHELVENELFGHERGAFTGASGAHRGLIREADHGTLFLDEIDSLPPSAQVKLLRFLQEKEYRSLGSTRNVKADVRIITASNTDFEEAISTGRLRRDLYFRLNVIELSLPPLRERRQDIPLLARHFLTKYSSEFNQKVKDFSARSMDLMLLYDWPGNVRELQHCIQRAVVLCQTSEISDIEIPSPLVRAGTFHEAKANVIGRFEKDYIQGLLIAYKGNITHAARAAGKNRRAFWQLIRKHGIEAHSFKPASRAVG